MKQRYFLPFVFICLSVLLHSPRILAQVEGTTENLKVMVQPEIEIFSVIDYLGRGKRDMSVPSDYKTEVEKHFRKHAQHPSVKYWQSLQKKYSLLPGEAGSRFTFSGNRYALRNLPAPDPLKKQMTAAEWKELETMANSFAATSGFPEFHKSNHSRYTQWQKQFQEAVNQRNYVKKLLAFTGINKDFGLHLDALDAWGAYHVNAENNADNKVLLVWGYCKGKHGAADKPPFFADSAMLNNTLWHEMAHTYINPLVAQQAASLKNLPAIEKVRKSASRYYELVWDVALSELLVRGMVASLVRQELGDAAAEREIQRQLRTFGYDIAQTEALLTQQYLKNRNKYPTIQSFFPVLISQFDNPLSRQ